MEEKSDEFAEDLSHSKNDKSESNFKEPSNYLVYFLQSNAYWLIELIGSANMRNSARFEI